MKAVPALLTLLVSTPIWYYLMYQILVRVEASELMFFLFWVYVPVGLFANMLMEISKSKTK